jgi:hypothetical protein
MDDKNQDNGTGSLTSTAVAAGAGAATGYVVYGKQTQKLLDRALQGKSTLELNHASGLARDSLLGTLPEEVALGMKFKEYLSDNKLVSVFANLSDKENHHLRFKIAAGDKAFDYHDIKIPEAYVSMFKGALGKDIELSGATLDAFKKTLQPIFNKFDQAYLKELTKSEHWKSASKYDGLRGGEVGIVAASVVGAVAATKIVGDMLLSKSHAEKVSEPSQSTSEIAPTR